LPTTESSLPEPTSTSTTLGAREHARAQGGTIVEAMPTVPPSAASELPLGVQSDDVVWFETVPAGGYTTKVLDRGVRFRLTDTLGDACAHVLLFHAQQPFERLNVADTVKVLWSAYPTVDHLLLSDQGRVLASIVQDSSARHDTMCGPSTLERNRVKYGSGSASGPTPAGRELFVAAAAKHGLEPRDLPACISFFQGVTVELDGTLRFDGSVGPGASIDLVAELPVIVLLANAAHPLDPRPTYVCTPLQITAWKANPTTPAEPLWSKTPERERAFLNTADYLGAAGAR